MIDLTCRTRNGFNWLRIVSHDRRRVLAVKHIYFLLVHCSSASFLHIEVSSIEDNETESVCHENRKENKKQINARKSVQCSLYILPRV
jgi:hypothetical protein